MNSPQSSSLQTAAFAGGCFWCTEAVFERLKGVIKVVSGYAGGQKAKPTYEEVSSGSTQHAEAVQVTFDPSIITYSQLLEVFWAVHDPTTLNRQGADVGTQYRSAIFYENEEQQKLALASKAEHEKSGEYHSKIVTEIVPFTNFYTAEEYHQNYYDQHPENPYCSVVIDPKVQKLLSKFGDLVKDEYR